MNIKVLRLGHSARVIDVPAGSTVADVLAAAETPSVGYALNINGLGAGQSTEVGDGDVITLVPKVEGG